MQALNRAARPRRDDVIDTALALRRRAQRGARRRRSPASATSGSSSRPRSRRRTCAGRRRTASTPTTRSPPTTCSRATERSLRNLGLDTVDVQQFHVWSRRVGRPRELARRDRALKAEGKIRAFGVSINDHQPANAIKLIESGAVDTVQVIYNVFDQSPEDELLDACARARHRRARPRAVRRGRADRRDRGRHRVPGRRLPQPLLPRRPQAAGRRARAGDPRRPRHRARAAAGAGAPLHPLRTPRCRR